jgi:cation transport ATPase
MMLHKRPETVKLSWRRQTGVFGSLTVLLVTGLVWLYLDNFIRIPGEFGLVKSPIEPGLMKIHGAFAMIMLTVMGTLFPIHIKGAWHRGRNRVSGMGMAIVLMTLAVTGYGLYYAAGEEMRHAISLIHWITGVAIPLTLGIHVWVGKRTARKRQAKSSQDK